MRARHLSSAGGPAPGAIGRRRRVARDFRQTSPARRASESPASMGALGTNGSSSLDVSPTGRALAPSPCQAPLVRAAHRARRLLRRSRPLRLLTHAGSQTRCRWRRGGFGPGRSPDDDEARNREESQTWQSKECSRSSSSPFCGDRRALYVLAGLDAGWPSRERRAGAARPAAATQRPQRRPAARRASPASVPENADELAKAHKAYDATLPPLPGRRPGQGADDPEGHGRRDRAGREVQHVGLRRPRRAGPGRPRPRGPDRRDDADERRRDPALDRLPRRRGSRRTSRSGTSPRASRSPSASRRRPRRLHVPLRHEARARAHRERDVRRDRRRAPRRRCRRSTTSTCSSRASGT